MIKGDIIPIQTDLDRLLIKFWLWAVQTSLEKTIFYIDAHIEADKDLAEPYFEYQEREQLEGKLEKFRYEIATKVIDEQKTFITDLLERLRKQKPKKAHGIEAKHNSNDIQVLKQVLKSVKIGARMS